MMTKKVKSEPTSQKSRNWAIFEELLETNENLDEACSILYDLQQLIRKLPNMSRCGDDQDAALAESVFELDTLLDKFSETTGVYFDEIEMKLDSAQKSLLNEHCTDRNCFLKLVTEIQCNQKVIDTLISNAEEEVYKFLESEELYIDRRNTDAQIIELVLNS